MSLRVDAEGRLMPGVVTNKFLPVAHPTNREGNRSKTGCRTSLKRFY